MLLMLKDGNQDTLFDYTKTESHACTHPRSGSYAYMHHLFTCEREATGGSQRLSLSIPSPQLVTRLTSME